MGGSRSPQGAGSSPPRRRTPSSNSRNTSRAASSASLRCLPAGRPPAQPAHDGGPHVLVALLLRYVDRRGGRAVDLEVRAARQGRELCGGLAPVAQQRHFPSALGYLSIALGGAVAR